MLGRTSFRRRWDVGAFVGEQLSGGGAYTTAQPGATGESGLSIKFHGVSFVDVNSVAVQRV
jgi:hypothetical protein